MSEKYPDLVTNFIDFVKVNTRSDENSTTIPSSPNQVAFIDSLESLLKEMGVSDLSRMDDGYLFAKIAANVDTDVAKIGFIAHVDTADFNAENVSPQIIKNYDGKSDIALNDTLKLTVADFPSLTKYVGEDLITTDGTTLLGADDKAGLAEIFAVIQYVLDHPEFKHGELRFAFGPDEEIGIGADNFHVKEFDADFAYTIDGGEVGELQWETFNAAEAKIKFLGRNVHPGTAKNTMINAVQLAMDFHAQLPEFDRPENTEDREGFWHIISLTGEPEEAELRYIIRDHDRQLFEERKQKILDIAEKMNNDYDQKVVEVSLKDQYYNMGEIIEKDMTPINIALEAMENLGIKPITSPVRGGTDGSKITFLGLPTPNIFAGGENMHGKYEYVSVQSMQKAADTMLEIIKLSVK